MQTNQNHPVDNPPSPQRPLIRASGLKVYFPVRKGIFKRVVGNVKAVDNVDIEIQFGETVALVGESGCGKTTAGKSLLRLIEPTAGVIQYRDIQDIRTCPPREMRRLRQELQIIFQDPYGSMDPRMTVRSIVAEGPQAFGLTRTRPELDAVISEALDAVQLSPSIRERYIHEFSGGQRQRVCIARALAVKPRLVVLDEAVSSLDVSIRAQILNLLRSLQERFGLTYLLITHDLSVVQYVATRIAVMYLGQIVEEGPCEAFFAGACHPYTQALLRAIPSMDPDHRRGAAPLQGTVPSPFNPPTGCRFHPRCPHAMPVCAREEPSFTALDTGLRAKCFLPTPPKSGS